MDISNNIKKSIITFIIPTIGRKTLLRTIKSLKEQYIKRWEAIIIFDGIKCNINKNIDKRIKILEIEKKGNKNTAGKIRNIGLLEANTDWVGFIDDDDTINKNYINILLYEKYKKSNIDCFIYRMYNYNEKRIIPNLNKFYIKKNDVGISFVINKKIYKSIKFKQSIQEDFYYLLDIKKKKFKIRLLGNISYYIRSPPLKLKKYYTYSVNNPKFIF